MSRVVSFSCSKRMRPSRESVRGTSTKNCPPLSDGNRADKNRFCHKLFVPVKIAHGLRASHALIKKDKPLAFNFGFERGGHFAPAKQVE